MKVVAVINYKGGVGKTTTTANLGAELANRGKNVLLIDLDPQSSLTFSFITAENWQGLLAEQKTIRNWFEAFCHKQRISFDSLVYSPSGLNPSLQLNGKLDLISSHLELINTEVELASELGGSTLRQTKKNYLEVHSRLSKGLSEIETFQYDIVLIDCPPNFGTITKNAIVACDYVLVPAKPDYLSTMGIWYLKQSFENFVNEYNEFVQFDEDKTFQSILPNLLGVVFSMVKNYGGEPISDAKSYIKEVPKDIHVFSNYFWLNASMFGDDADRLTPVVLKNAANATEPQVIYTIKAFVDEFENLIQVKNGK